MNRTLVSPSSESIRSVEFCQQEYQSWRAVVQQQEEEIGQLRALLLDVMDHYTYRSLRHCAVDYYRDLSQLQARLNWLNRDCICQTTYCSTTLGKQVCADARFALSATIERQVTYVLNELGCVKAGCLQFLSGMVSLNLL